MEDQFFIPGADKDVPITCVNSGDGWSAQISYGLVATARTQKAALLKLAREAFKQRQKFGLVGGARLRAMEDCKNRLDALNPTSPSTDVLAWRVRAKVLGCQVPASVGLVAWDKELRARTQVVREYVNRSLVAGHVGRPGVHYTAIVADPPWMFQDVGTRMAPAYEGKQRKQARYQALPLPEILALGEGIKPASAEDSILFLWVPASLVAQDYHGRVARAWGFTPKTLIPWIKTTLDGSKPRMGGGHYARAVHEEIAVATRGDMDAWTEDQRLVIASRGRGAATIVSRSVPGVIFAPRTEHSAKPDAQYELIDALMGDVPKLELFARKHREGYDAWGDEAR
jgi:N6-adenosine-specific RNA methylase IME4